MRDYKKEYKEYHSKKTQKLRRAMRNKANRELDPGPGKEVDHKTPLSSGGSNSKSNWRVVSRSTNRKKYNKTADLKDHLGVLIGAPVGSAIGYYYGDEPSILNTLAGTSLGTGVGLGVDLLRKEGLRYFLDRPAELASSKVLSTAGGVVAGLPGAAVGAMAGSSLGATIDDNIRSKLASDQFKPDFTPEQLKELGVYDQVYGDAPSEASMKEWPEHWINKQDPLGWLQWYERYSKGRRTEDDERQIKRWKSFKARHLAQYNNNPTERRAAALRNWGIDVKEASAMGPLSAFVKLSEKGVAEKTNPAKWEAAKREAKSKMGGKHSARAMQLATQIYKKKGGGYSGKNPSAKSNKLKKWTKQDWQWSGERKKESAAELPGVRSAGDKVLRKYMTKYKNDAAAFNSRQTKINMRRELEQAYAPIMSKSELESWRNTYNKHNKLAKAKGVYLPAKSIDALKSSDKGKAKLKAAVEKKRKATSEGRQVAYHGLHKGKDRSKVAKVNPNALRASDAVGKQVSSGSAADTAKTVATNEAAGATLNRTGRALQNNSRMIGKAYSKGVSRVTGRSYGAVSRGARAASGAGKALKTLGGSAFLPVEVATRGAAAVDNFSPVPVGRETNAQRIGNSIVDTTTAAGTIGTGVLGTALAVPALARTHIRAAQLAGSVGKQKAQDRIKLLQQGRYAQERQLAMQEPKYHAINF